ncbi:MAG: hypothetical protein K1X83_14955 [Oligoflexia bacterium]|nr:hypothetical protein [Oligoflexia bacterium]
MAVPFRLEASTPASPASPAIQRHSFYAQLDRQVALLSREQQQLRNQLAFGAAGAALLALVWGLNASGYFISNDPKVPFVVGVVLSAIAAALVFFNLGGIFRLGWNDLKAGMLGLELSESLAIGLFLAATICNLAAARDGELQQSIAAVVMLCALFYPLERAFSFRLWQKLSGALGFRIEQLAGKFELLGIETGKNLPPKTAGAEALREGDLIKLPIGSLVPCDGIVVRGSALVAERKYGGASYLSLKNRGSELFAGSKISRGELMIKVTVPLSESEIAPFRQRLDSLVAEATSDTGKSELIQKSAVLMLWFIAACIFVSKLQSGASAAAALYTAGALLAAVPLLRLLDLRAVSAALAHSLLFLEGLCYRALEIPEKIAALKSFFIDSPQHLSSQKLLGFEVLDDRFDQTRLRALLGALFAAADTEAFRAMGRELAPSEKDYEVFEISEYNAYAGRGIAATVSGAELSVGDEDFMLERGVYLQTSEVQKELPGEYVIFVALGLEIVGRVRFARSDFSGLTDLVSRLRRLRIKPFAISAKNVVNFDAIGKQLGLELVDVVAGLSLSTYKEKLEAQKPAGLLLGVASPAELKAAASVSWQRFDELKYDLDSADVTICSASPAASARGISMARRLGWLNRGGLFATAALGVAVCALVWGGLIGAEVALLLGLLGSLTAALPALYFLKEARL